MVKFKSSSCGCPFSQPHLLRNLSFTKMDALGAFVASQLATNLWVLTSVTYVIMSGSVSVVCHTILLHSVFKVSRCFGDFFFLHCFNMWSFIISHRCQDSFLAL